jgi:hypothetical protein
MKELMVESVFCMKVMFFSFCRKFLLLIASGGQKMVYGITFQHNDACWVNIF